MIDYEVQVEGKNLRRGLIILGGRPTSDRSLRIVILIGPGWGPRGRRYTRTRIGVHAKKDSDQAVGGDFCIFAITCSSVARERWQRCKIFFCEHEMSRAGIINGNWYFKTEWMCALKTKQSSTCTILIIIDKRREVFLIPKSGRRCGCRGSKKFHVAFTTFRRKLRLRGTIYEKVRYTRWTRKSRQPTRRCKPFTSAGKSEKAAIIEWAIDVGRGILLPQEMAEVVEGSCRGN